LDPYNVSYTTLISGHQVQALRTAFTLNNALKRLFLSSTGMTSAGAICLAEFLPESNSLLHVDLTSNSLELAGVMALNQGLKSNHVMRCLDLNIPPSDEEMARYVPQLDLRSNCCLIIAQYVSRYPQHMCEEYGGCREGCSEWKQW
jgi:hypothetical protein